VFACVFGLEFQFPMQPASDLWWELVFDFWLELGLHFLLPSGFDFWCSLPLESAFWEWESDF
jgi:hypothetical protein